MKKLTAKQEAVRLILKAAEYYGLSPLSSCALEYAGGDRMSERTGRAVERHLHRILNGFRVRVGQTPRRCSYVYGPGKGVA